MLNPMVASILLYLLKQMSYGRFSLIRVVAISRAQRHPVVKIEIFFSQNFVDMYACLGSPITQKMLTQILEAMFPPP